MQAVCECWLLGWNSHNQVIAYLLDEGLQGLGTPTDSTLGLTMWAESALEPESVDSVG